MPVVIRSWPLRRDGDGPSGTGPRAWRPSASVTRFAALLLLIGVLAAGAMSGVMPDASTVSAGVDEAGVLAPVVVVVVTSLLLASLVPRSALAAAAGVLFGALPGALYVMAGALLGAGLAFEIGRWLGRDFVRNRRRGAAVDRFLLRRGLLGVLMLRVLPIAPFGLVSYSLGATAVRRPVYLLGTALGIAPSTLIFATLGASAMAPASPAFLLSTSAAAVLAMAGVFGARRVHRDLAAQSLRR